MGNTMQSSNMARPHVDLHNDPVGFLYITPIAHIAERGNQPVRGGIPKIADQLDDQQQRFRRCQHSPSSWAN